MKGVVRPAGRHLPLVKLVTSDGGLLGRCDITGIARHGEWVSLENMGEGRTLYSVLLRKRSVIDPRLSGQGPVHDIEMVLCAAEPVKNVLPSPGRARMHLIHRGRLLATATVTTEPEPGDQFTVNTGGASGQFTCVQVERWLSHPAPAPDASTLVYRVDGLSVHLAPLP